ncbi:hypothetical protein [Streptomyces sp. NPDC002221]|uniref:hypothetical protein n=1 Tax=Streptomyces sp. NPDC002221 TaxID=3364639 RepID=UPI0036C82E53
MIPAVHPYQARYRHENDGSAHFHFTTKPVIAWSDEGIALVADEKTGRLRKANTYSNFAGVSAGDAKVVAALPGGGWLAEFREEDGTSTFCPVIGWRVQDDGTCTPADSCTAGIVENPTEASNFVRLHEPNPAVSVAAEAEHAHLIPPFAGRTVPCQEASSRTC